MRRRTVADRLGERFIRPMESDRLAALSEPAMDQARQLAGANPLEEALASFSANPTGAGLDVPHWLRRLEVEVQRVRTARTDLARLAESMSPIPKKKVPLEDLQAQLQDWDQLTNDPSK